jgi:hypothetical protein
MGVIYGRDEKGRFMSPKELAKAVEEAQNQLEVLKEAADVLVASESQPPAWLRDLIVVIADHFGITPEEFKERIRVVHPTQPDPVILVDGKPVVSWI